MKLCLECEVGEVISGRFYCSLNCSNKANGRKKRIETECSVEGCDFPHKSKGYCAMHYARVNRTGAPGEAKQLKKGPKKKIQPPCSLEGCEDSQYSKGYCSVHAGKDKKLRQRFGINLETYLKIWKAQGEKCAICPRTEGTFHVDHSHELGHVRGILCHHCNTALGNFGDSIETMEKAIDYLQERGKAYEWEVGVS